MPQSPSPVGSKFSSLTTSPCRWLYPWLPAEHDVLHCTHEAQLGYQRHIVRLMLAVRSLRLWECFLTPLAKIADIRVVRLFGHFLPF